MYNITGYLHWLDCCMHYSDLVNENISSADNQAKYRITYAENNCNER